MRLFCSPAPIVLIAITISVHHKVGTAIVDYKHEDCRYHVHFHPLSWSEAYNVCKDKNQTLLKLDDVAEHSKISSLVDSKINNVLSTNLETVWIGLQASLQGGDLHHFWPDCDQLTSHTGFNPWQTPSEDQKEGCVVLNPSASNYSAVECTSSFPYICEHRETDPVQCFFPETESVVKKLFSETLFLSLDQPSCAGHCHTESYCAGVMYGDKCTILTRAPTAVDPQRGTLYPDGVIDWNQYTSIASTTPPRDACSVTSHSALLATPTAIFSFSGSVETSAEPSLTTLYPSTASHNPSSSASQRTPYPQTVSSSIFSTPVIYSAVSSSSSVCYCPCLNNVSYTPEELQHKIEKMKSELTVEKKQTNKYKRSLISVPDSRPSAKGIGSSVGVLTLCIVIALLVAFDFPRASRHAMKIARIAKARFTKKQH